MIKRYVNEIRIGCKYLTHDTSEYIDYFAMGMKAINSAINGLCSEAEDMRDEPPSKVPCPECGGSGEGEFNSLPFGHAGVIKRQPCKHCVNGYIYKYWTLAERDQWREGNHLPPDSWVGAVYAIDAFGRWRLYQHSKPPNFEVCVLGNTPPPKNTYEHGEKG